MHATQQHITVRNRTTLRPLDLAIQRTSKLNIHKMLLRFIPLVGGLHLEGEGEQEVKKKNYYHCRMHFTFVSTFFESILK